MNKKELRKVMLLKRKDIPNKAIKSIFIVDKIKTLKIFSDAKVIAMYKSLPDEVCLDELISFAQQCGKKVLFPKVVGDKLDFILIDKNTRYEKSKFNVIEPVINNNIWQNRIDLMLIPGVAFDKDNNRLGYGKGYYDKYLERIDTYKVGVCFSEQIIPKLDTECYDIKMDLIINEKV